MSDQRTALITGATGLLGRQIVKAFERAGWNTVGTGFSRAKPPAIRKVDLCNEHEIVELLDDVKPQVVIHSAAQRSPDICSNTPAAATALNTTATRTLASYTHSRSILLLYISTDYVFPGRPGEAPYTATSTPEPTNHYGVTKLEGERAVLEETKDASDGQGMGLVLRVPVLYGDVSERSGGTGSHSESAINVLMDILLSAQPPTIDSPLAKTINMDDWAIRYPTNTEDVGRVCADIARVYMAADEGKRKEMPRVLQYSAQAAMTKYRVCEVFAEIMGVTMGGLVPVRDGGAGKDGVVRPFDTHLSTQEMKNVGVDVGAQDFVGWWRRQVKAYRK